MRILASILAAAQVPLIAWMCGYDFDARGVNLAYTYFMTLFAFGATYFYPGWER